jgi:hypothetical protein
MGTLKEVEHLPEEVHIKRDSKTAVVVVAKSYESDYYSF